ncbi:MAG: U32 family peptidase [Lachnospiraceae bacterium]|jgi:putative protease|nr:U32 family peptidase [Lachnospiraceae bacterium]
MNKPELLAPAGSFKKAKTAFTYGADAVYCGTSSLSLRTRAEMDNNELYKTIKYAHDIGKKVYTTINIFAWDERYEEIKGQVKELEKLKVDGVIVADGGVLELIKEVAPTLDIHISTQANIVGHNSSNFWYKNGANRVILARELNKNQIKELIKNKNSKLETEIFVHGAICFGYSGRCFLSDFLAGRSANLGDCAQSCRWGYNVYVEEVNNKGNLMPVETDENGTYIFSSKDLCLIKEIPEIVDMGINSLKIEGRLKTEYYLATVINAYRNAIDDYIKNPQEYDYTKYLAELEKVKTRGLTTFYFNDRDNKDFQEYEGKQYNPDFEFGAIALKNENEKWIVEIKNKLQVGDKMELIIPKTVTPEKFEITELWDVETDEKIDCINPGKLGQLVKMKLPKECKEGFIIRREKNA